MLSKLLLDKREVSSFIFKTHFASRTQQNSFKYLHISNLVTWISFLCGTNLELSTERHIVADKNKTDDVLACKELGSGGEEK